MEKLCVLFFIIGLCHGVSENKECTERGRFPNDEVEDCRGYTICLMAGPSNFIQYKLSCPIGFVYSHIEQQCTNITDYLCLPNYSCTRAGIFPDSTNEHCTSYVACVNGTSEIVTARLIACSSDTIFNPTEGTCVNITDFKCKTDMPNIDIPEISTSFVIEHISRFPNFTVSNAVSLHINFIIMLFAAMSILF